MFTLQLRLKGVKSYKGTKALDLLRAWRLPEGNEFPASPNYPCDNLTTVTITEAQARELLPPDKNSREIAVLLEDCVTGEVSLGTWSSSCPDPIVRLSPSITADRACEFARIESKRLESERIADAERARKDKEENREKRIRVLEAENERLRELVASLEKPDDDDD